MRQARPGRSYAVCLPHISMNLIALTGKRPRMKVGRQLWCIVVTLNWVKTEEELR